MNRRLLTLALLVLPLVCAAQARSKAASGAGAKPATDEQLYRNATFGFRFQIPYGWVDRTREMHEQGAPENSNTTPKKSDAKEESPKEKGASQGDVLLSVFERPPDAIGETINSAVVIASESAATYPGLKKAEDCVGPFTELTTSKGFKVEGEPSIIDMDSKPLVRLDFSKHLTDALTMYQTTLVLFVKGRVVSFTFLAGDENEVDDLIERLHFGVAGTSPHRP
jgi:hypothetical protein